MIGTVHQPMHNATMLTAIVRWAAPQLVVYVITALVAAAAFVVGAALYAHLWPAPAASPLAPPVAPVDVPHWSIPGQIPNPTPTDLSSPLVVRGDGWKTISGLLMVKVFDVNNVKIGDAREVLVTSKGNAEGVVINLTDGAAAQKRVAVPFHAIKWTTDPSGKDGTGRAVVMYTASQLRAAPAFPPN